MNIPDAYFAALGRNVLPTSLSTEQLRRAFATAVRDASIFSARTTNIPYLSIQKEAIEAMLKGKRNGEHFGKSEAVEMMRTTLEHLRYDPERGHFGTPADANLPPAKPGSIRDLSSFQRIELILDTQLLLASSKAQKASMLDPENRKMFPFVRLAKSYARKIRLNWLDRWRRVGGRPVGKDIIAEVDSPTWRALGTSRTFRDALDTDVPPFAFGSKRAWEPVTMREAVRLGLIRWDGSKPRQTGAPPPANAEPPAKPPGPEPRTPADVVGQPAPRPAPPPMPAPMPMNLQPPPREMRQHEIPDAIPIIPPDANDGVVRRTTLTVRKLRTGRTLEDLLRQQREEGEAWKRAERKRLGIPEGKRF